MDREFLAVCIQEGGRILTEVIRTRPRHTPAEKTAKVISQEIPENHQAAVVAEETAPAEALAEKAQDVQTGCLPCAISHFGTCSGLLNEAMRFARADGISSPEAVDRFGMCLDELNTMERVDLRPELINSLPAWEKELANEALNSSRDTRHEIDSIISVEDLEKLAGGTQTIRREIGRKWFQVKLDHLTPEQNKLLQKRVKEISKASAAETEE